MAIRVLCTCGKPLLVKEELEGRRVRCPACQQPVLVQGAAPPTPQGKRLAAPEDETADQEESRPRPARRKARKPRRAKASSNRALWIGIGGGAALLVAAAVVVVVIVARSGKQDNSLAGNSTPGVSVAGNPSGPPKRPPVVPPADGQKPLEAPFLDQQKEVPPRLEWNREVVSKRGGTFSFRITSEGPFSVLVVTARGYQALQSKDRASFQKEDVLLNVDSKGPMLESEVTIPAGSSWFIIENQTDKAVRMHLQCYNLPKS
jgi:hypothetical protein